MAQSARRRKRSSRARVQYTFDSTNRLLVTSPDGAADGVRIQRVISGAVTTDAGNRLIYRVDTPAAQNGASRRRRFDLDGTWGITPNHQLFLTLHEASRLRRQTLYLKGAITKVEAHAITLALRRHTSGGDRTIQRLRLSGRWQADRKNRLSFLVERSDGSDDRLTFQSGWKLGRHNTLIYRYRKHAVGSRRGGMRTLRFAGVWDLTQANRLVYRLDASGKSAFDFRASLQTKSLNAREGRIVYQVGIGLSSGKTLSNRVTLFGRWKLNRDLSVSFEIPYADGRREGLRLNGTYSLSEPDAVTIALRDRRNRPMGLSVTFTRRLFKDGQVFLRLRKAGGAREAIAGVQVPF